jgi:hypothetical protein
MQFCVSVNVKFTKLLVFLIQIERILVTANVEVELMKETHVPARSPKRGRAKQASVNLLPNELKRLQHK